MMSGHVSGKYIYIYNKNVKCILVNMINDPNVSNIAFSQIVKNIAISKTKMIKFAVFSNK